MKVTNSIQTSELVSDLYFVGFGAGWIGVQPLVTVGVGVRGFDHVVAIPFRSDPTFAKGKISFDVGSWFTKSITVTIQIVSSTFVGYVVAVRAEFAFLNVILSIVFLRG